MIWLMILAVLIIVVAVVNLVEEVEHKVFSDERIYMYYSNLGYSHDVCEKMVKYHKPKVGQQGLPAWESTKTVRKGN